MPENTIAKLPDPSGFSTDPFTDIIRDGARKLIEQAIQAELAVLMAAFRMIQAHIKDSHYQAADEALSNEDVSDDKADHAAFQLGSGLGPRSCSETCSWLI